jgi:hypothetical protein
MVEFPSCSLAGTASYVRCWSLAEIVVMQSSSRTSIHRAGQSSMIDGSDDR